MKRIALLLLAFMVLICMTACGGEAPKLNIPLPSRPPSESPPQPTASLPPASPDASQTENPQGEAQGEEKTSGFGYGETTEFPADTRWVAENSYWICDLYLLGNGEAYLQWEFSDGTMCPLTGCYWTLTNDYLLLFNNGGVEIEGSLSLENLELRYEDEAEFLLPDESANTLKEPMAGTWAMVSVTTEGWTFDPNDEGIFSWITIYDDQTVDYHWQNSYGKVYDERGLTMQRHYGALWHGCGNEFWYMELVGNSDTGTSYYLTEVGDTLLLMERYEAEGREMADTSMYQLYSP